MSWASDSYQSLYVKGVETSDSVADIGLSATFTPTAGIAVTDAARATVFDVDMTIAGVAEADEAVGTTQQPGQPTLALNRDDDNRNSTPDKDDTAAVSGENDLVTVQATTVPLLPGGVLTMAPANGYYTGTSKLWRDPAKAEAAGTAGGATWNLADGACPTLWLEGTGISSQLGDAAWTLSYAWATSAGTIEGNPDEVPLTVQPRYGKSEAWLQVFRGLDANGQPTNEGYDPIGGHVQVVLNVRVGAAEQVAAGGDHLLLRVRDLYDKYDSGYDETTYPRVWDWEIDLTGGGWQRLVAGTWQAVSGGPASLRGDYDDRTEDAQFRRVIDWNTMTKPLGNNGLHAVYLVPAPAGANDPHPPKTASSTRIAFEKYVVGEGGGAYQDAEQIGPLPKGVRCENLYIPAGSVKASNGTIDYFKWNYDGEQKLREPSLVFDLKDADTDPDRSYTIVVKYRKTSGGGLFGNLETGYLPTEGTRNVHAYASEPGQVTVPLTDLEDLNGEEPGLLREIDATDWFGTLTYDIWVAKSAHGEETDSYMLKGPYSLWVPPDDAPVESRPADGKPGHQATWVYDESDGTTKLRAHYWLHDQRLRDASEMALLPVDPELKERRAVDAPLPQGTRHGGGVDTEEGRQQWLPVYTMQDDDLGGTWRLLWTGADSAGPLSAMRRTHDARRMVVANETANSPHALAIRCSNHPAALDDDSVGTIAGYLRGLGYGIPRQMTTDLSATNSSTRVNIVREWFGRLENGHDDTSYMPTAVEICTHGSDGVLHTDYSDITSAEIRAFHKTSITRFAHLSACSTYGLEGDRVGDAVANQGVKAIVAYVMGRAQGKAAKDFRRGLYTRLGEDARVWCAYCRQYEDPYLLVEVVREGRTAMERAHVEATTEVWRRLGDALDRNIRDFKATHKYQNQPGYDDEYGGYSHAVVVKGRDFTVKW